MADDEADDRALRAGLRDVPTSNGTSAKQMLAKGSAARALARFLQRERPEPPAPRLPVDDDDDVMAQVVERFCPEFRRVRDDPMRDLHAQVQLGGRRVDERIWGWLPVCPANVAEAERAILDALDRLDVGEGPFDPPGRDS